MSCGLGLELTKLNPVDADLRELAPGLQTLLEQSFVPLDFTYPVSANGCT